MQISLATALFALNTAIARYSAYERYFFDGVFFSDEFFISPLYFWPFWPSNQAYLVLQPSEP